MFSMFAAPFVVGFIVAIPPGAVTVIASNISIREKLSKAFIFILGAFSADIFYLLLVYFGVSSFLFQYKIVKIISLLLMGIILILIGADTLRYKKSYFRENENNRSSNYLKTFFSGIMITLLNPITIAGWFGVAGSFFAKWHAGWPPIKEFGLISIIFIMTGVACWIFPFLTVIHKLKHFFSIKVIYGFSLLSGCFLLFLAAGSFKLAFELIFF